MHAAAHPLTLAASLPSRGRLRYLFRQGEQLLAVRVATEENAWADALSRGEGDGVLAAAVDQGLNPVDMPVDNLSWVPLRRAMNTLGGQPAAAAPAPA